MAAFAAGETDVLVATSVIEVGIDVANASVMVIEDADRYGLSQLHQLRGRIGRGEHESYCILFGDAGSERASARLAAIKGERDGFRLAEVDLTLRGEGEVLGTRQSGPAPLPRRRAARRRGAARRGARGPARAARAAWLARGAGARTARRDRPRAVRRRARRADRRLMAAGRKQDGRRSRPQLRIVAGELRGRRLRSPEGRGTADGAAHPRGDLLDARARGGRGGRGPRSLLRQRRAWRSRR